MTQEQKKLVREQVHRLVDIALDTNGFDSRARDATGTLPTVFFNYSGHVNKFELTLHPDGWTSMGASASIDLVDCYLDKPLDEERIQETEAACKKALTYKTEAEVLARDISKQAEKVAAETETLANMRQKLTSIKQKEKGRKRSPR